MKYQPYREIINLAPELKEYRKLCRGKSKKFTYYLEWKEHISKELLKLESYNRVENFKRFLINHNRVNKNINTYHVSLIIFGETMIFNTFDIFKESDEKCNILTFSNIIMLFLCIAIVILGIIHQSDYYNKEYCFYCDVLEILEEIYKKEED